MAQGKICRHLRSPGDLLELPFSLEDRRADLEEEDLLSQGDRWDRSIPELEDTGPVMEDSQGTGQDRLAGARDLHTVLHKVQGRHSLVSVDSRGSRGRKEEPPGQEVQEVDHVPCTCVVGVPC